MTYISFYGHLHHVPSDNLDQVISNLQSLTQACQLNVCKGWKEKRTLLATRLDQNVLLFEQVASVEWKKRSTWNHGKDTLAYKFGENLVLENEKWNSEKDGDHD